MSYRDRQSLMIVLLIKTVSIFAVSYILPGVQVDSFVTALIVTVVLADVGLGAFAAIPVAVWSLGFLGLFVVSLLYHRFGH